jgi:hypothetical protein
MATGYHRLNRKAKHLIHQLRHTKSASLQRLHLHELRHAISKRHGFNGPGKTPDLGKAGHYRPLTRRAKQLLHRLRHSRVWSIQKQLVNELVKEIERGRYLKERIAKSRPARVVKRVRQKGRQVRNGVRDIQEVHLARAERRQAERERRTRKRSLAAVATFFVRPRARPRRQVQQPALRPAPVRSQPSRAPRSPDRPVRTHGRVNRRNGSRGNVMGTGPDATDRLGQETARRRARIREYDGMIDKAKSRGMDRYAATLGRQRDDQSRRLAVLTRSRRAAAGQQQPRTRTQRQAPAQPSRTRTAPARRPARTLARIR